MHDALYAFLFRLWYQIRNWKAHARSLFLGTRVYLHRGKARIVSRFYRLIGLQDTTGTSIYEGTLSATLIKGDGRRIELGVISRRVVTTAGANYIRDSFGGHAGGADVQNMKYHDSGTGVGAEAIGDTDLGTPAGPTPRATGTQDVSVAKVYTTVGTITYTGTLAITEHGVFNQAARGAGSVLLDRSVFAAINVVNTDSIQFTYSLTIADGG